MVKSNDYFFKKYKTSANVAAIREISQKKINDFDYFIVESSYTAGKNIKASFICKKFDVVVLTNVYLDHIDGISVKNQDDLFQRKLN